MLTNMCSFHFAGVGNLALTQGVPRIKEIINVSKEISTPIITCQLVDKRNVVTARIVKGRIEKTFLRDIIQYVEERWDSNDAYLRVKLNNQTIRNLELELHIGHIINAIKSHRRFKGEDLKFHATRSHIRIYMDTSPSSKANLSKTDIALTSADPYLRLRHLKNMLADIQVLGHPQARRAVIHSEQKDQVNINKLLVEGYGLKECMTTDGVEGAHTKTNNIMETRTILGIEAARQTIIDEMCEVMKDMDIDPRHVGSSTNDKKKKKKKKETNVF
jgi:DNA-directed RNA polymerase III subunit RPC1